MAKKTKDFDKFVDQELGSRDGGWMVIDDGCNPRLPRIGVRCQWMLRPNAPIHGHAAPKGFIVFGYRCDLDQIYLPLYHEKIFIELVQAWKRAEGPDYWNGSGRSVNEAFQ